MSVPKILISQKISLILKLYRFKRSTNKMSDEFSEKKSRPEISTF